MVNHIDLVHVHAGIAWEGHELAVASKASGMSCVVRTEHCPYVLTDCLDIEHYDRGIGSVSRLISVSRGVARSFASAGVSPSIIRVVRNGISVRRPSRPRAATLAALGLEGHHKVVVTVARLTHQKGHRLLAQAVPEVAARLDDVRFVWVGTGPLEAELRDTLARLGVERHVDIRSNFDDVPGLIAAADVVAMPSRFEGLPLVALEAMAYGRPTVGTSVVGLDEAIVDGVTGRLVPVDDPSAFAGALIEALTEVERTARWSAAARQRQRLEFTARSMARATAAVYYELLDAASGVRSASVAVGARPMTTARSR